MYLTKLIIFVLGCSVETIFVFLISPSFRELSNVLKSVDQIPSKRIELFFADTILEAKVTTKAIQDGITKAIQIKIDANHIYSQHLWNLVNAFKPSDSS